MDWSVYVSIMVVLGAAWFGHIVTNLRVMKQQKEIGALRLEIDKLQDEMERLSSPKKTESIQSNLHTVWDR